MNYYNKYLKYKNKYLKLKNQIGGTYTLNLEEWKKIENSGQHNCGIFISDVYPKYILKCDSDDKLDKIIEINKTIQLFPKIIDSTKIDKDAYITMQKLDGDITNIYFNLFPRIVLKNMIDTGLINKQQEETIFEFFLGKMIYTMKNSKDLLLQLDKFMFDRIINPEINSLYIKFLNENPQAINNRSDINIKDYNYKDIYSNTIDQEESKYNLYKNKLDKIKKFSNISLELYDIFINKLKDLWNSYHEIITKEIIKIKLILINFGYTYEDDKLDNFGYILSNLPLDDFRKYQAPRIFGKYLYIYFLDWESGFGEIWRGMEITLKLIVDQVNSGLNNYAANGQSGFTAINVMKIHNSSQENLELLGINPEILKILQKNYLFDLSRFKHSFTTIEEVEKFIYT